MSLISSANGIISESIKFNSVLDMNKYEASQSGITRPRQEAQPVITNRLEMGGRDGIFKKEERAGGNKQRANFNSLQMR